MFGLITWSKREKWRSGFVELLDWHSAQACAAAGVEMEDVAYVFGVSGVPPERLSADRAQASLADQPCP